MERGMAGGLKTVISGIVTLLALFSAVSPGFSQTSSAQLPAAAAPPAQVREMMQLMQTPEVKQWMSAQMAANPAADAATQNQMSVLSGLLQHARRHVSMVSDAAMTLPSQIANASGLFWSEIAANGFARMVAQFLAILLLGAIVESVARYAFRRRRRRLAEMAGMHLTPRVIPALVFATATMLALFSLSWPPLSQSVAIVCVIALIVQRFTICVGGVLVDLIGLARATKNSRVSPFRPCPDVRSRSSGTAAAQLSSSILVLAGRPSNPWSRSAFPRAPGSSWATSSASACC